MPACRDAIPPVATLVGDPLPDDLVAGWRRSCGTTSFLAGRLLTGFAPYSIDEAIECRTMMPRIAGCESDLAAEPAGSRRHLPPVRDRAAGAVGLRQIVMSLNRPVVPHKRQVGRSTLVVGPTRAVWTFGR